MGWKEAKEAMVLKSFPVDSRLVDALGIEIDDPRFMMRLALAYTLNEAVENEGSKVVLDTLARVLHHRNDPMASEVVELVCKILGDELDA